MNQNHSTSPIRYDEDSNGNQAGFLNAGKKPSDCKMVAKALFSFQVNNCHEKYPLYLYT